MTPERSTRAGTRRTTPGKTTAASLDLACCRVADGRLAVLRSLAPEAAGKARRGARANGASALPWIALASGGAASLDAAAARLARSVLGGDPSWIGQLGAFNTGGVHPSGAALSVAYVAVVPAGTEAPAGTGWVPVDSHAGLTARQRAMVEAAPVALRERMDLAPIAFRMLPATFTLSELQELYELLLGRRLHKASFRRALQGAYLVAPTDEWRSEGRGRPAQLFRYAPRKRKRGTGTQRRPVRFELLG